MIVGIGIDIVETARIRDMFQRHGRRMLNRILTEAEQKYVLSHADPTQRIAGRWVAKEAALKALGTGLSQGIRWKDLEILPDTNGKPILTFAGEAKKISDRLKTSVIHISITHVESMAMGQVILEAL